MALATYLMLDASRGDCDTAVLVTNDSDLREPLRLAREELGLTTGVINPHPANRRSRALQATFACSAPVTASTNRTWAGTSLDLVLPRG